MSDEVVINIIEEIEEVVVNIIENVEEVEIIIGSESEGGPIKHEDTTERDAANSHPAEAISLEDTNLGALTIETFSEAYQLLATDTNKIKRCTSAVDLNVTIPLDLALPMPVGIEQAGNGVVTVMAGDVGVTINGDKKTAGQYKMLVIMKVAANTYTIIGGTS
jgi:hypothetical protein